MTNFSRDNPNPSDPKRWDKNGAEIIGLILFLLAEFLLFDGQTSRHHTWIYPRWNDQIQYLTEAYLGYDFAKLHGFFSALGETLVNPSAQGTLHDFYALLMFSVVGPSRSAALAINLLALIAWQLALFTAVLGCTKNRALAWVALALPLVLAGPTSGEVGSMIDFRLDHLAMCTVGVALAAVLRSDGFKSRGWSLAFGGAVGVMLITRFLTGAYLVVIVVAFSLWTLSFSDRGRRMTNVFCATFVGLALAAPIFWINRQTVWIYYFIGHFTGPESAIRNPHMGVVASLEFVGRELSQHQLGVFFWGISGAAGLLAVVAHLKKAPSHSPLRTHWLMPGLIFLGAPALVLTLHSQKSSVVLSVLCPGAVVVLLAVWAAGWPRLSARFQWTLAMGIVGLSAGVFTYRVWTPPYAEAFLTDARKVNRLADYIWKHSHAAKLSSPRVAVDQVTDCLDAQILRVVTYERHHEWVPFVMTLPTGIAEEKPELLLERIAQSDFVFLTEDGPEGAWPYDREMRRMLPQTRAWCEAHLRVAERFTLFGKSMVLYQRSEIP